MKKRLLVILMSFMLILSLIPSAAMAAETTDTWAMKLKVSESSDKVYNGQNALEIGFNVQSEGLTLKTGQYAVFAVDSTLFDLLKWENEDQENVVKQEKTISSTTIDEDTEVATEGAQINKTKYWNAKVYYKKSADGKTIYVLFQPSQDSKDFDVKSGEDIAKYYLGFASGKSKADLNSTSIRFATQDEAYMLAQGAVVGLTDGTTPQKYLKTNTTDMSKELEITPEVVWADGLLPTGHTHSWSSEWSKDDTHHWHNCSAADCDVTENSGKDGYEAHSYDQQKATDAFKATDATCTAKATYYKSCVCGAKGSETFEYGEFNASNHTGTLGDWQTDNSKHWKTYSCCSATAEEGTHVYDDDADTTCDTCGYTRTITPGHTHSWSSEWSKDDTHHWHNCSAADCDVTENSGKEGYAAHTPDREAATKTEPVKCSICGYIITPATGGSTGGGSYRPSIQKPEITIIGSGKANLSLDGKTATISADAGNELVSITLNGKEVAKTDKLTGLKTGDKVVITFRKTADDSAAITKSIASKVSQMQLIARSSKTAKKNIKVVLKTDAQTTALIKDIQDLGYTVKYKFYRSTKKSASYKAMLTKDEAKYLNTIGKKGTMYYYKARVMVYDKSGKLVAKSELKQCKYANRLWTK